MRDALRASLIAECGFNDGNPDVVGGLPDFPPLVLAAIVLPLLERSVASALYCQVGLSRPTRPPATIRTAQTRRFPEISKFFLLSKACVLSKADFALDPQSQYAIWRPFTAESQTAIPAAKTFEWLAGGFVRQVGLSQSVSSLSR